MIFINTQVRSSSVALGLQRHPPGWFKLSAPGPARRSPLMPGLGQRGLGLRLPKQATIMILRAASSPNLKRPRRGLLTLKPHHHAGGG